MKKIILLLFLTSLFILAGCSNVSVESRNQLYSYLESKGFEEESYSDNVALEDMSYGGFSNYGYLDHEHLDLLYLRDTIYVQVIYHFDYVELDNDMIRLTVSTIEITYQNIAENEVLYLLKSDINEVSDMTVSAYEDYMVFLYELRLKDVVWVIDALGYELK